MSTTTTLPRLIEAFPRGSSCYFGEHADWLLCAFQHRDSDCLARSNFRSFLAALGGESETVQVERASCSLVGWREYVIVDPTDSERVAKAEEITKRLEAYPVVDENDWSDLEYSEYSETFEREAQSTIRSYLRQEIECLSDLALDAIESAPVSVLQSWHEKQIPSGEYQHDGYPCFNISCCRASRDDVAKLLRSIRNHKPATQP